MVSSPSSHFGPVLKSTFYLNDFAHCEQHVKNECLLSEKKIKRSNLL